MANVPESMLRLKPIDTWSTREKLALATYAQKNNDQNFSSSKGLKAFAETPRPDDWFSRRMCALQYREMIDVFEKDQKDVPKRKRRDKGTKETSLDIIVKNLTDQRRAELQDSIPKLIYEQCRLQAKLEKIKDPANRKEFLEEAKKFIREHKAKKEKEEKEHDLWLSEREGKINNMLKTPMIVRQPVTPKVLVKQEAIDIEMKPLDQPSSSVDPPALPSTPTTTVPLPTTPTPSSHPLSPPITSPTLKEPKEIVIEDDEIEETKESSSEPEVIEISETAPSETMKSESDDKTETSEDIMEDSKTNEPESPVSQPEIIEEIMPEVKEIAKVPKTPPASTPVQNRPTRSHSKTISESHSVTKDTFDDDDNQSQASTVDSSIPEESVDSRPSRDSEKDHKENKFNKRAAIRVLNALQNHRFVSYISSPVAMKVGKEMVVKKLDISQIKRKIENDQIASNDEFSKNLSLIFLAALYSNNIDWRSPDYSKIEKMRDEIMEMLAGEEKAGGSHRSKRI